jgi:hypothetical protein
MVMLDVVVLDIGGWRDACWTSVAGETGADLEAALYPLHTMDRFPAANDP